jgi:hypothetical protein
VVAPDAVAAGAETDGTVPHDFPMTSPLLESTYTLSGIAVAVVLVTAV